MNGIHEYDKTQITYEWGDNWKYCSYTYPCKHCDAETGSSTVNISYADFKLTATFAQKDNVEPAVLDITNATSFTNDEIKRAINYMIGDGESDSIDVKLTLASDADSDVFTAIVEALESAKDGSVNLTIDGANIPEKVFMSNKKLKTLTFGDSVNFLGKQAFWKCTNLITLNLGNGVNELDDYVFDFCESLTTINFGNKLETIGAGVFSSTAISSVVIPDSVTSLGNAAFGLCSNLETVICGKGITSIEGNPFQQSYAIKSLTFKSPMTSISFNHMSTENITLTLAKGQKILEEYNGGWWESPSETNFEGGTEFCDCTFEKIIVPIEIDATNMESSELKSKIEDYVSKGITDITVNLSNGNILSAVNNGLSSASNGSINLTINGDIDIPMVAFFSCNALKSVTLGNGIKNIEDMAFEACRYLETVNFSEGLISIGTAAFDSCIKLQSISLPNGLQVIGNLAFANTSLKSIHIPASITSIGKGSFIISKLETITIDEENSNYKVIDNVLYTKDEKTLVTYVTKKTEENYTILSEVENIEAYAFYYCDNLKSIIIDKNVKSIGEQAFRSCSNLDTITFNGTVDEWNAIEKGYNWNLDILATEVICTDGNVSLSN